MVSGHWSEVVAGDQGPGKPWSVVSVPVNGQLSVVRSLVSGHWSAASAQWFGQRSVVSGHWSVIRSAVSGQ